MDTKELRKKTNTELEKILDERSIALNKFKFGTAQSKLKNTKEGKNLKREIAQIMTIINEMKKSAKK